MQVTTTLTSSQKSRAFKHNGASLYIRICCVGQGAEAKRGLYLGWSSDFAKVQLSGIPKLHLYYYQVASVISPDESSSDDSSESQSTTPCTMKLKTTVLDVDSILSNSHKDWGYKDF